MTFCYYDESIRDQGKFIIGALVISSINLTTEVQKAWLNLGLNPEVDEYKSSTAKRDNCISKKQRDVLRELLIHTRLGLVICSTERRSFLGEGCAKLFFQLFEKNMLEPGEHKVYIDQNIKIKNNLREQLCALGVEPLLNQDSQRIAGLQVADHAAHALGGMLLEQMGLINKTLKAGPYSGYDPDTDIDLGFELWAGIRHSLIGKNEDENDIANPYLRVEGLGLLLDPELPADLVAHSLARFGVNYVGCIH
jgi:hypothetical protein